MCGQDEALLSRVLGAVSEGPLSDLERRLGVLRTAADRDLPPEPPERVDQQDIGPYRVLEKLGEGGFGVVYVAEQLRPMRRRVALKVIKAGMDSRQVIARFEAERQALALMDHPNIARMLDAGTTALGRPYFVMELVRGAPITSFCDANRLSPRQRLELMIPVCQAVQHAHQKGVIHRDIKPNNVLVTLVDGAPTPKIIDFGVAKAISTPLTAQTVYTEFRRLIGTPAYMSPEQLELSAQDVDTRADVYALGVVLYEMLSGRLPFDAEALLKRGLAEMQRVVRETDPPRPSARVSTMAGGERSVVAARRATDPERLSPALRGDLDWIVMRAIDRDRRRRYDTAEALGAELRRHLDGEPVLARPPSRAYAVSKFVGRHQAAVAAGLSVVLALLLGLAAALWGFASATRDRNRATEARAAAEQQSALRAEAEARALRREYAAKLSLADDIIHRGVSAEGVELLSSTAAQLRGWEWRHVMAIARGSGGPPTQEGLLAIEQARTRRDEVASRRPPNMIAGEPIGVLAGPAPEGVYLSISSRHMELRSDRLTIECVIPRAADWDFDQARISTDGRWIAVSEARGDITALRLPARLAGYVAPEFERRYLGLRGRVADFAWTAGGEHLVAKSVDGQAHQWPVGAAVGAFVGPSTGWALLRAEPSPDGRIMFLSHWGLVRAVETRTGMPIWTTSFSPWYIEPIVLFDRGRKVLALSAGQSEATVLDAETGRIEAMWSSNPPPSVPVAARPPLARAGVAAASTLVGRDGRERVVLLYETGPIIEIDPNDWSVRGVLPRGWPEGGCAVGPTSAAPGADRMATTVVTGPPDNRRPLALVLAGSPPEVVLSTPIRQAATALGWSSDGQRLLVGDALGVSVLDGRDGGVIWRSETRSGRASRGVAWIDDPCGARVASSDAAGALRIFDASSGEPVLTRSWNNGIILGLTYVKAEDALVGASETSSIMRLETGSDPESLAIRSSIADAAELLWTGGPFGPTSSLRDRALRDLDGSWNAGLSEQRRDLLIRFNRGAGDDLNRLNSDVIFGLAGDTPERIRNVWLPATRALIEARPNSIAFRANHGWACVEAGLLDEAETELNRANDLMKARGRSPDAESHAIRARLRWRQGRAEEARALLAMAEKLAPTEGEDRVLKLVMSTTRELLKGEPGRGGRPGQRGNTGER